MTQEGGKTLHQIEDFFEKRFKTNRYTTPNQLKFSQNKTLKIPIQRPALYGYK